MIVFTHPYKYPRLSGLATLGAGIGGGSIYGLVLYDLSIPVGLVGAMVGIAVMLTANHVAEKLERKSVDAQPSDSSFDGAP